MDSVQKQADVNAWLKNSSLYASSETLSPGSDASSTTILGSDFSEDEDQQFEDECIRKMSLIPIQVEDEQLCILLKQIYELEREFEDLSKKIQIRVNFTTHPKHFSNFIQEGPNQRHNLN